MVRVLLLAIFVTVLTGLACTAQDTRPHLNARHIQFGGEVDERGLPVIRVDDFRDLPYDYARQLPHELYYWWALAHNARQEERTPRSSPGVLQIKHDGVYYGLGDREYHRGTTTIRRYDKPMGSGPVMLYNPYFR